jgi:hypothetical protein
MKPDPPKIGISDASRRHERTTDYPITTHPASDPDAPRTVEREHSWHRGGAQSTIGQAIVDRSVRTAGCGATTSGIALRSEPKISTWSAIVWELERAR